MYRTNAIPSDDPSTKNNAWSKHETLLVLGIILITASICVATSYFQSSNKACKDGAVLMNKGQIITCSPGDTMHIKDTYNGPLLWCSCPGQKDLDIKNINEH